MSGKAWVGCSGCGSRRVAGPLALEAYYPVEKETQSSLGSLMHWVWETKDSQEETLWVQLGVEDGIGTRPTPTAELNLCPGAPRVFRHVFWATMVPQRFSRKYETPQNNKNSYFKGPWAAWSLRTNDTACAGPGVAHQVSWGAVLLLKQRW